MINGSTPVGGSSSMRPGHAPTAAEHNRGEDDEQAFDASLNRRRQQPSDGAPQLVEASPMMPTSSDHGSSESESNAMTPALTAILEHDLNPASAFSRDISPTGIADAAPDASLMISQLDASGWAVSQQSLTTPASAPGESARAGQAGTTVIPATVTAMMQELLDRIRLGEQRRWSLRLEGVGKRTIQVDVIQMQDHAWQVDVAPGAIEDDRLCRQLHTHLQERLQAEFPAEAFTRS